MVVRLAAAAIPVALVCFVGAVVLRAATNSDAWFMLLVPAGIGLVVRGAAMVTDWRSFLTERAAAEQTRLAARLGFYRETRFGGVLLVVIGCGWAVMGGVQAFR